MKKFQGIDKQSQKILIKEAKLLNGLQHPNIVGFKGVRDDDYALLLEYVYFDFVPLGTDLKVNSLADLFCHFDLPVCANIGLGLQYLHENGLTHTDLKQTNANVLVSNKNYCHLSSPQEIERESSAKSLIFKLMDFCECR